VETTATFVENLFPNCPEEKLKKKINIPEPIHPSEEEATGNNDENNHQPPPDDLEFPPIDPPQPGDGHINGDDSNDTTKPQSLSQCPPKPTVEEVIDNDTQAPQGGRRIPDFNPRDQTWEYPGPDQWEFPQDGMAGRTGGYVPLPRRNPAPPPRNPFLVPPQQC